MATLVPDKFRPWRSLALLGLFSLAIHLGTIFMLEAPPRRPTLGRPVGTTPAVKLKVIEKPKLEAKPKPPSRGSGRQGTAKSPTPTNSGVAAAPTAKPKSYTDLLPSGAWHGERVDQGTEVVPGTNVGVAPPTRAAIDEFSGRLDIPLFSRTKGSTEARAVAKIRRLPDGGFQLDYLDGEPLMRACLYVALIQPANLEILGRLMASEGKDEFLLTFTHTESLAINLSRYADDFSLADGRLTIRRTTFQPIPGSGMALPDEHAKRAKARDRANLERLKDTPAFHSPLRQRLLTP